METDSVFDALADPTRRQVLQLLGGQPMRASDLARAAGQSRPGMSRHLRVLLGAGMVQDERDPSDARLRIFRLRAEGLEAAHTWLDQVRADWGAQLESFREQAEGTVRE
jgi:DNA-binding transcriptional ArsR family regulator